MRRPRCRGHPRHLVRHLPCQVHPLPCQVRLLPCQVRLLPCLVRRLPCQVRLLPCLVHLHPVRPRLLLAAPAAPGLPAVAAEPPSVAPPHALTAANAPRPSSICRRLTAFVSVVPTFDSCCLAMLSAPSMLDD